MKSISSMFLLSNTVIVACIYVQFSLGNGQICHDDSKMIKLLLRGVEPLVVGKCLNIIPADKPIQEEVDISRAIKDTKFRNNGRFSPFSTYRPNFVPISYYGKRQGGILQTIKSNYYVKNSQDDKIQYEKRSISSAVVRGNLNQYETLLKALNSLQSEKDGDIGSIINNYDIGLKQVLEHLLPQLPADKIENIKKLLNSMIKRRFGSWGGRKRSEFYSWGGRKKRNEMNEREEEKENSVKYLSNLETNEDDNADKEISDDTVYVDLPSTSKRDNDFYPWGGKRTIPPNLLQY